MIVKYLLKLAHVSTEVDLPDGVIVLKSQWNHNSQRFDLWYLSPIGDGE